MATVALAANFFWQLGLRKICLVIHIHKSHIRICAQAKMDIDHAPGLSLAQFS